ncbi:MAG: Cys-tRNA(Pro) deacylase [Ignavibacterium sp.]|jgi:Cys-tRNA(Pro)/Cys-tRNA(Cys) deacylase|nr:Cys-tRNA(Pro) deacylase [Ignavibacterium sp.]HOP49505.1 Cys-tRNA(Pro) deacylase [Ignavibacteriales bacterium]
MKKTNAIRLLEKNNISFDVSTYEVDENSLDAISVANKINAPVNIVYKTLVTVNDKKQYFVFVIPGDKELNLKKAAAITQSKKIDLIKQAELQPLTGYIRGGTSPVGMKKPFPTFIHQDAQNLDYFFVSGGMRGIQIKINPLTLANFINAQFGDLI